MPLTKTLAVSCSFAYPIVSLTSLLRCFRGTSEYHVWNTASIVPPSVPGHPNPQTFTSLLITSQRMAHHLPLTWTNGECTLWLFFFCFSLPISSSLHSPVFFVLMCKLYSDFKLSLDTTLLYLDCTPSCVMYPQPLHSSPRHLLPHSHLLSFCVSSPEEPGDLLMALSTANISFFE